MNQSNYPHTIKAGVRALLLLAVIFLNLGPSGFTTAYAAAPINDNWASAASVSSVPFSQTINVREATIQVGEPRPNINCDGNQLALGNNSVWYKFTSGTTRFVSFDTVGSDYDTYIVAWTGNSLNNLTLIGCDDDYEFGLSSQLSFTAQAGTTYYLQIAKYNGTQGGVPDYTCDDEIANNTGILCDLTINVKYQTFIDVPPTYWSFSFIERLYNAGVTGGCIQSPLQYCPEATVTRAQMAVFLLRGAYGASYQPPAVGSSTGFGDVPTNYWAAAWIKQLVQEGITSGCGSGNYCPEAPVTRAQMAVFLLRSKNIGSPYGPPPVGASTGFSDVPTTYWAAAWIKELVAEGVTSGCGSGNYCPDASVTRAQMAVFLVKTFNMP